MNTTNPFNKTLEELTNENMNNENQYSFASNLNLGELLAPKYEAYDPYPELEKDALKASQGESVEKFADIKDKFVKPKFTDLEPNQTLIDMNIRELENDFERQDALKNQANFLFNPQEGNTPEERAKSQRINKLLAEIDNFAIQYNLSERQKEQLKSQVLSQHLGEYISTKQGIEEADLEKERQEAMDLARGRTKNNNPIVRDPETMDDNNMRPDAEGMETVEEGGAAAGPASGAGGATTFEGGTETTRETGDPFDATKDIDPVIRITEQIYRDLMSRAQMSRAKRALQKNSKKKLIEAVKNYNPDVEPNTDIQILVAVIVNYANVGETINTEERRFLTKIMKNLKHRDSLGLE